MRKSAARLAALILCLAGLSYAQDRSKAQERTCQWRQSRLVGTVVAGDVRAAIFQLPREEGQRVLHIGDVVQDATIADIAPGAVLLQQGARRIKLFVFTDESVSESGVLQASPAEWDLPKVEAERAIRTGEMVIDRIRREVTAAASTGGAPAAASVTGSAGTFDIGPDALAELGIDPNAQLSAPEVLSAVNRALRTMQVRPHLSGGIPDGFVIDNLQPGGPAERIGLRNGDIIRSVNGYRISTVEDVFRVYMRVKDDTEFVVEIERDGQIITRTYKLQR